MAFEFYLNKAVTKINLKSSVYNSEMIGYHIRDPLFSPFYLFLNFKFMVIERIRV